MNPELHSLLARRMLFVMGKGGTGKSTISAALALSAAKQGKRVLVTEMGAQEKISQLFGAEPVGTEIRPITEGVSAVNIEPQAAMREYGLMILRYRFIYHAVFENRLVRYFLQAVPGLAEVVTLGKIWYHEQEREGDEGRPRFDLIIIDCPATGHGISMLQVPRVVSEAAPPGPLRDWAEMMLAALTDEARTSYAIVTVPEEMAINEAVLLTRSAREALKIPTGLVLINAAYPTLIAPGDESRSLQALESYLERWPGEDVEHGGGEGETREWLGGMMAFMRSYRRRRNEQQKLLERLRALVDLPTIEVPFLFEDHPGPATIERLRVIIEEQIPRWKSC